MSRPSGRHAWLLAALLVAVVALYVAPFPRPLGLLKLIGAPLLIAGFHTARSVEGRSVDWGFGPTTWRALLVGLLCGGLLYVVRWFAIEPAIEWAFVQPKDLDSIGPADGDDTLASLLFWILLGVTWGALLEEFVWRGFILRFTALLLGNGPRAWTLALLSSSLAFGAAHAYQGPRGIASTAVGGFGYGLIYVLTGRRSLWPVIAAHGLTNTTSFILDHLGID